MTTQEIERRIIQRLVRLLLDNGFQLSVNGGMKCSDLEYLTMQASVEGDSLIRVYEGGIRIGGIFLIQGNGRDVISDWSSNLDDLMAVFVATLEGEG